jgi:hypothetical protein
MNIKHLVAGAMALAVTSSAMAQTTITVTGATAFRQATVRAIYDAYNSVSPGLNGLANASFNVAYDFTGNNLSQLIASNRATFRGTFPGISGTTVIQTSFNGSAEGLNAIAGNNNPSFLTVAAVTNSGTFQGGTTNLTENKRPKFSFSDVYQSSTPVDNEVLNPVGASAVGVVTFAMIANEGAPANWTNVTFQQARALWSQGIQRLRLFTGVTNDTTRVFATGRNDGSGTRASYLSEWQYGVAETVQQYITLNAAAGTNATGIIGITAVPEDGRGQGTPFDTGSTNNASTLWGNTTVGNGGFSSSSALRTVMGLPSTNVTVWDGADDSEPVLENANILLLTWLSTADSVQAAAAGAKILAYNGVQVTPLASTNPANYLGKGFNEADFNKIARGTYSAWNYQHLYYSGSLSPNETLWYNSMKTNYLPTGLQVTANGLTLTDMKSSRPDDGFAIVAPLAL